MSSSERLISAKSPVCRPWTNAPRFAHCLHRVAERHGVAEQRARLRGFDFEIGVDDDRRQAGRHRQPTTSGGLARRTSTNPPQMHGAMLSACAEPAPSRSPSSAQAISVSTRRLRADQRVDRHDRRRGARRAAAEAARQRQALADRQRDAARLAELRQQRQHRHAGRVARRLARQTAAVARDVVDRARPPAPSVAVTSSPGSSSAKPRTSKPQATFETVAGAKAVTEVMSGSRC